MDAVGPSSDQFSLAVSIDISKMNGRVILRLLPVGWICAGFGAIGEGTARCQLPPPISACIIVPRLNSAGPARYQFRLTVSVDIRKLDGGVVLRLIPVGGVA